MNHKTNLSTPIKNNFIEAHTYKGIPVSEAIILEENIISILEKHAKTIGNQKFLTVVDDEGNDQIVSFTEIFSLVLKWTSWFNQKANTKIDTVGIIAVNDLESVVAILGLLNTNRKVLFINPTNPSKVTTDHLDQLKTSIVLKSPSAKAEEINFDILDLPLITEIKMYEEEQVNQQNNWKENTFYFPTSGSTSASKLVIQTQYGALVNANALIKHHKLGNNSLVLGCLPIYHVNGFHFTVIANLIAGSAAILVSAFSSFTFPQYIEKYKPTIVSVVPSIVEILLMIRKEWDLPKELKYFVTAAAPLGQNTAQKAYEQWKLKIMQGYGLTETINFSTKVPVDISSGEYEKMILKRKIPSIGIALFGNEVALLDGSGTIINEEKTEGEIAIRGHNVMKGYFKHQEETEKAFKYGWFHSGDIGYFEYCSESKNRFFFITGRAKNIAKVRGESISLEHMERVLKDLSFIKDVACIFTSSNLFEEQIIVAYVTSETMDFDIDCCKDKLKEDFPKHAIPEKYIALDTIPRTPTGKLKRQELKSILDIS
jgi:long-chain acyl-CoA synthetase